MAEMVAAAADEFMGSHQYMGFIITHGSGTSVPMAWIRKRSSTADGVNNNNALALFGLYCH